MLGADESGIEYVGHNKCKEQHRYMGNNAYEQGIAQRTPEHRIVVEPDEVIEPDEVHRAEAIPLVESKINGKDYWKSHEN